jgi:hypothetical protein
VFHKPDDRVPWKTQNSTTYGQYSPCLLEKSRKY